MHIAIPAHAAARYRGELVGLPTRVCRLLVQAWLDRLERRIARAATRLDRAGLLDNVGHSRHHD